MNGIIEGGWEFVWAAYIIVWGGVALYIGSVSQRSRRVDVDATPEE